MARLAGFEPATLGLEDRCSIQMSYRRMNTTYCLPYIKWSGQEDLNLRPPAPKAGALPDCAMPRCLIIYHIRSGKGEWVCRYSSCQCNIRAMCNDSE